MSSFLSSFTSSVKYVVPESEYIKEKKYFELGLIYEEQKLYKKMKKYYELAIRNNNVDAMNNLGYYYHNVENKFELAKKYLHMAVDNSDPYAMNNLGLTYYDNGYYENAKHYYQMAIEYEVPEAYNNLGLYYYEIEKSNKVAKLYFLDALQRNNDLSRTNINLITTPLERYVLFKQYKIPFSEEKDRAINIFINRVNMFGETRECTICFEEYTNIPTECGHYLCVNCYVNLFTENNKTCCPICRIEINS